MQDITREESPWHSQEVRNELAKAASGEGGPSKVMLALIAVISGALFVGGESLTGGNEWSWIAMLVGVLLFHEAGHLLAMRLFGYRDLKVFFIPFFGAAASGKKNAASGFEQAIVLLAGPLPGIFIGTLLLLAYGFDPLGLDSPATTTAWLLLSVNLFNLLPTGSLDGGRFLDIVVFGRFPRAHRYLQIAGGILLAGVGYALESWLLGLMGVVTIWASGAAHRTRTAGRKIQQSFGESELAHAQIPDEIVDPVATIVADIWRSTNLGNLRARTPASLIMSAWNDARVKQVRGRKVAWLLCLYIGAIFLPIVAVFIAALTDSLIE